MQKINVMISSTVNDLKGERNAIKEVFINNNFIKLIGAEPLNTSSISGNSRMITSRMARECDLYILILGKEYGYELRNGKSATEIEFDEALKDDPTKILIFKKSFDEVNIDPEQKRFIHKVCDYHDGYWRSSFKYTHELKTIVEESFTNWLKERASIGKDLDYLDHFIRVAKQLKPEVNSKVYYQLTENLVELEYVFFNQSHVIHFERKSIYSNFWGCINSLQYQFDKWLELGDD